MRIMLRRSRSAGNGGWYANGHWQAVVRRKGYVVLSRKSSPLQAVRTVKFCKIPVEGTERQMTGFAGNFQNEAIGEAH